MISPAKLLAVLVADCDGTAKHIFWGQGHCIYQHSELDALSCTSWYRIVEDIDHACIDAATSIEESATSPPPTLKDESKTWLSKRPRITKKSNEFLVAWFLAHKDNPYPSFDERVEITDKSGLAEQQVHNWFANMRKRHWKSNRANAKKPRSLLDYVLRQSEA
ncbi:unnamed protein product [Peronospora destructor]|uniref:Homeobox domain-containing protein n=1 Tax=Peronospora destructor TaxID=86335 RepID=A0AAV0U6I0_9STRA|nr:unnamed protein product [Peronospora destructor]